MSKPFYPGQTDYFDKLNGMDAEVVAVLNRNYGALPAAPATRPDGTPMQTGDHYFDTVAQAEKTFNGSVWYIPSIDSVALATPSGSSGIGHIDEGVGAVPSTVGEKLREFQSVKGFGAIGNGIVDDAAAIQRNRTVNGPNKPLHFPGGKFNSSVVGSPYGGQIDATFMHLQQGIDAAPSTENGPIILIEKVTSANALDGNTAPSTVLNVLTRQVTGNVGTIPITGHAEVSGNATGAAIGITGRARGRNSTAGIWGGWFYAEMSNQGGGIPSRTIGCEFNVKNSTGVTPEWRPNGGLGSIDGIVVATVDSIAPGIGDSAIRITKSSGDGWLTGVQFGVDSVCPSDANMNGEAVFLNGTNTSLKRFGGFRFGEGANNLFHYALRTNDAGFNNNVAIWLGENHRIRWGAAGGAISSGPYLHYSPAAAAIEIVGTKLNIAGGSSSYLHMNGVQVLAQRKTGWANMVGTPNRTAFNTNTATIVDLAERVKALVDDLISHGLIGN